MAQPLFGIYRGIVVATNDPRKRGRLKVKVPSVLGTATPWAIPCVPYTGKSIGTLKLPPVGAQVWVQFERGNAAMPVWVGCF